MATLTKPLAVIKPSNFKPRETVRVVNAPTREIAKDVSRMNKKANDRIKTLAKQNIYSYALEARYRDVHNTRKDTKVDWEKVLKAAQRGELNFRMPDSQRSGFKNQKISYDQKKLYKASNDVYDFLNAKTSTKTGIVEWVNEVKFGFGFRTDTDFMSKPIEEQAYALREAFRWLSEIEKYMEETGDALSPDERYKVTEYLAEEISQGGFNTSGMSIDEVVESIKKVADELTRDTSVQSDFTYAGKTYHFY